MSSSGVLIHLMGMSDRNNFTFELTASVCVCSQAEQPGFLQQLHQQQHGEPAAVSAAEPHRGAAPGSDQTAHDPGHHH